MDRNLTPWVTVTTHCPLYNTFTFHRHDPQPLALKKHVEPLLVQFKVNFVLSGHIHAYMRTKNTIQGNIHKSGPIHLIVGSSGRQANAPFFQKEAESWVAKRENNFYGYSTIEFMNSTTVHYEWILTSNDERNITNYPKDSVYIHNQYFL